MWRWHLVVVTVPVGPSHNTRSKTVTSRTEISTQSTGYTISTRSKTSREDNTRRLCFWRFFHTPINKPRCRLKSRASLSIGRSRARVYREVDLETATSNTCDMCYIAMGRRWTILSWARFLQWQRGEGSMSLKTVTASKTFYVSTKKKQKNRHS